MLLAQGDGHRSLHGLPLWAFGIAASALAGLAISLLPLDHLEALALVVAVVAVAAVLSYGHQRSLIVIGAIVYVGALHWVYIDWVAPVYSYSGLISSGADWPVLLIVTLLSVLPAAWLPIELGRPSDIVLWFLYLVGYVPACAIPIHLLGPELWPILPFLGVLAIAFATLGLMRRIQPVAWGWPGLSQGAFTRVLVVLGLGAVAYLIAVFGIPTGLPSFDTVYDARAAYASVANTSAGAGYIVPWAGNVIFPFLIALGMARPRGRLLILGVAGELLVYGTAGFKSVLFSIALVPLLYLAIRHASPRLGTLLIWAGVAVLGLSVAATWVSGSIWPLALFVTRLLAVPGQMTAYYYDFFSSHQTLELSRSFLRWFVATPYDVDPPYLIAALYLNSPTTDANANLWADAMANFGLLGIVPFTLLFGGVMWILDSVAWGRDLRVVGPTLGLVGITLGNGALFTSILTLGLGLAIGLIALMPRSRGDTGEAPAIPRAP